MTKIDWLIVGNEHLIGLAKGLAYFEVCKISERESQKITMLPKNTKLFGGAKIPPRPRLMDIDFYLAPLMRQKLFLRDLNLATVRAGKFLLSKKMRGLIISSGRTYSAA